MTLKQTVEALNNLKNRRSCIFEGWKVAVYNDKKHNNATIIYSNGQEGIMLKSDYKGDFAKQLFNVSTIGSISRTALFVVLDTIEAFKHYDIENVK